MSIMSIKNTFPHLELREETEVADDDSYAVAYITNHHERWYFQEGTFKEVILLHEALLATTQESDTEPDYAIAVIRLNEDLEFLYIVDNATDSAMVHEHLTVVEGKVRPMQMTEI